MGKHVEGEEALQRFRELVKDIDVCMMTTLKDDRLFRSRPMSTNGDIDQEGNMYFFAREESHKVDQLKDNSLMSLTFSDTKNHSYISTCGTCELIKDKSVFKEHWKPSLDAWFPKGSDEPGLVLIKVTLESAEFWEIPGSFAAHTLAFLGSKIVGTQYDPSVHGTVR